VCRISIWRIEATKSVEATMFEITSKMLAKNYFPDIIGINLKYALDAYDWEGWNPI